MEPRLDVRPLAGPLPGLASLLEAHGGPSVEALLSESRVDPRSVLVALADAAPEGVLRGRVTHAGYCIEQLVADAPRIPDLAPAFLDFLLGRFPGQRLEARGGPGPGDEALHAALLRAGAEVVLEQLTYERALQGLAPPPDDPFRYVPFAETGKARMIDALAAVFAGGPSGCPTADPRDELDRMIFECATAGGTPDASLWWLVETGGAPAGVLLARRYRKGGVPTATILFAGVVPELRRRGLGALAHRSLLGRLAAAGVERYEDATGVDNRGAQRILDASGCRWTGAARRYHVRTVRETGQLAGFAELCEYLRSERHAVEILEPGVWARAPMVFAGDAAVIDLGWMRDERLLQVVHRHRAPVPAAEREVLAEQVAAFNRHVNVPGLVWDEREGALSFRVPIHLGPDGVAIHQLRRVVASVVHGASSAATWLRGGGPAPRGAAGDLPSLIERVPAFIPGARAIPGRRGG